MPLILKNRFSLKFTSTSFDKLFLECSILFFYVAENFQGFFLLPTFEGEDPGPVCACQWTFLSLPSIRLVTLCQVTVSISSAEDLVVVCSWSWADSLCLC